MKRTNLRSEFTKKFDSFSKILNDSSPEQLLDELIYKGTRLRFVGDEILNFVLVNGFIEKNKTKKFFLAKYTIKK